MIAIRSAAALALCLTATAAFAAGDIGGATLGAAWALPFAGMLLSIALGPVLFPHFWELNYGKFAAFWAVLVLVPLVLFRGFDPALGALLHTALLEYIPFIILLFALFTIAGGILIMGNLHGSPATNTALLAIGTLMASVVGTTGASIIMIRPVLRANDNRRHNVHVVVFFIFLVSNIGGSLTPLGDPPLFLGFLRGVDFFWTTTHLLPATGFAVIVLLALFFALDSWLYRQGGQSAAEGPDARPRDQALRQGQLHPARRRDRGDPDVGQLEAGRGLRHPWRPCRAAEPACATSSCSRWRGFRSR